MYALYFSCEEMIDPLTDISSLDDFLRHYETFTEPEGTPEFKGTHPSARCNCRR